MILMLFAWKRNKTHYNKLILMMSLEEKVQCFHNVFNQLSKTRQIEYLDNFCIRYTHDSTTIEDNTCSYFDTVLLLTEGLTPAGTIK